jgi:hypothetical protein
MKNPSCGERPTEAMPWMRFVIVPMSETACEPIETTVSGGDKDAGTVDEDVEAPEAFDDCFDLPLNCYARTVWRLAQT